MKFSSICLLSFGSLLFTVASSARAAIGSITCNSANATAAFTADVSYYDLTVTPVLSGGSGGVSSPGGGTVSTNPIVLYLPLANFAALSTLAANSATLSSCVLTAGAFEYDLNTLAFTSVEAIAKTPAPSPFGFLEPQESTAYTRVSLNYTGLRVVNH